MFKERFKGVMSLRESPRRLAASLATGIFIGLSPLFGVHTVIAIALIYALRLNMTATMTGVYITNPFTAIPIYTFSTWTGSKVLGMEFIPGDFDFRHVTLSSFTGELRYLLKPFVVGSTMVAMLAALAIYLIMHRVFLVHNGRNGSEK